MKLLLDRLEKPRERGGKIIARCPACAEIGKDTAGDNLVIFENGIFACAVYQGDAEHSKRILQLAGDKSQIERDFAPPRRPAPPPTKPSRPNLAKFHHGNADEIAACAASRRLDPVAIESASNLGCLAFGNVCGFPSWIITDDERRIAEGRRMDGCKYPEFADLTERKAHTLKGSSKSWPAGVAVLRKIPQFTKIMIVEGGPDYLAAFHFLVTKEEWHTLPVAILGRGTGRELDCDAVQLMRGKRVRIYPHDDADGGGMESAKIWAAQLHAAGCQVDFFDFSDLTRRDGKPVNDLNDAALLDPKQNPELSNLLP